MEIKERFVLRPKTTMRIGGVVTAFAEIHTKDDVEAALRYSVEQKLSFLPLGSGSNTIFADDVDAMVVQLKHAEMKVTSDMVTVGAGKNLPMLVNECADLGLDISALTGIPGTVGGAVFGNAGQGPKGVWIDSFIESVTIYDGAWKTLSKTECLFRYRESFFKDSKKPLLIWEVVLKVPKADPQAIKESIQRLLQKRIETQPHLKTAGSCFKAIGDTPAWKLIDAAGLRGHTAGGIEISTKHANFLINVGEATYADAVSVVDTVKAKIPDKLEVEMRFIEPDGTLRF